jgi:hypothetical protein
MKWLVYGGGALVALLLYKAVKTPLQTAITGMVPPVV